MSKDLASEAEIAQLVLAIEARSDGEDQQIARLLRQYPADPRLHFMLGSVLAGKGRAIEAHHAMTRAIELAPGFLIARYQLGFFELTSGEPERALSTWGPLLALPSDSYLRVFVEGMTHLIRDEFTQAIARFEAGIALNEENLALNGDIQLLIAECRKQQSRFEGTDDEDVSTTALLLGRFSGSRTVQ